MPRLDGPVLITGCSSGIGAATAARLAAAGMIVYASARRSSTLDELASHGCHPLDLDVTDEASMRAAVRAVEDMHGHVWALINNAGYGEYGAVEEVSPDRIRAQFETNVFGLVRLCQLVLPGMRAAGRGRIVNMSSMGGRLVFPLGGIYHGSKYAVEAITDALRFEVAPFGIAVTLVEPGLIRTGFGATAGQTLRAATAADSPYRGLADALDDQMGESYSSRLAASPAAVAATVHRALTARRPRPRYVITPAAKAMVHGRRLLGARVWDTMLRRAFRPAPAGPR
jgi:NADP-dependent 3-hydroxy acid dehydrogenase YdfG